MVFVRAVRKVKARHVKPGEAHIGKNSFVAACRSYRAYNFSLSQFSVPPFGQISKNQPIILYYENEEKASAGKISDGKEYVKLFRAFRKAKKI